jgi:hypothetical protein
VDPKGSNFFGPLPWEDEVLGSRGVDSVEGMLVRLLRGPGWC